jgi:hypothetical protein
MTSVEKFEIAWFAAIVAVGLPALIAAAQLFAG